MSHVFISYAREDIDFATVVRAKLEESGVKAWLDTRAIEAGRDWSDEIELALADAVAVLLVMSPASKASEYVAFEWAFALGSGARVIPLLYRATDLHPRLARLQHLDFTQPIARPWTELLAHVEAANAQSAHRARTLPRDAPASVRQAFTALDSPEYKPRRQAISALAGMSHPSALVALAFALEHPSLDVRAQAATTLADRGDARTIPVLLSLLTDDNWGTDSIAGLVAVGQPAVEPLLGVLKNSSADTLLRHLAAVTLALGANEVAREAARAWTRWSYLESESLPTHPTSRSVSIYSAAGYRGFVRTALAELERSGAAACMPPELQRLHAGGAIRHWTEVQRAAKGEKAHAIALPLWIEYRDGADMELSIAISRDAELSEAQVKQLFAPAPRRSTKPHKKAR